MELQLLIDFPITPFAHEKLHNIPRHLLQTSEKQTRHQGHQNTHGNTATSWAILWRAWALQSKWSVRGSVGLRVSFLAMLPAAFANDGSCPFATPDAEAACDANKESESVVAVLPPE